MCRGGVEHGDTSVEYTVDCSTPRDKTTSACSNGSDDERSFVTRSALNHI